MHARNMTCAPVNFALLNICGLASKATLPDLLEIISDHNIILLTETKMDTYDILNVQIPEYTLFYKNSSVCCHKSGGIAAYINNIVKYFTPVDNDSDTLWFIVNKHIIGHEYLLGLVYIPPESSRYSSLNLFDVLEDDIFNFSITAN